MAHFAVPHAIYWHSNTFEVVWHHATIYTYTHCTWPKRHAHKLQIGVINDCLLSSPVKVIGIMLPGYLLLHYLCIWLPLAMLLEITT